MFWGARASLPGAVARLPAQNPSRQTQANRAATHHRGGNHYRNVVVRATRAEQKSLFDVSCSTTREVLRRTLRAIGETSNVRGDRFGRWTQLSGIRRGKYILN